MINTPYPYSLLHRLVKLAEVCRFDGWLLNVEVDLPDEAMALALVDSVSSGPA